MTVKYKNNGDTNPKARVGAEKQDTIDGPGVSLSKSKLNFRTGT